MSRASRCRSSAVAALLLLAAAAFLVPAPAAAVWVAQRPGELPQTWFKSLALGADGAFWASALRGSTQISTEPVFCLLRSTDGGATWSELWGEARALGVYTGKIFALDAQHAWAVPQDDVPRLVLTHDGGERWQEITVSAGLVQRIDDLCFVDALRGWLAVTISGAPAVLLTADGGSTWLPPLMANLPASGRAVRLVFPDAAHGRLAVDTPDSSSVFTTSDGGQTWQLEATLVRGNVGVFQDLYQREGSAWAVTYSPAQEGAATVHRRLADGVWEPVCTLPNVGCQEIVFRDSLRGAMLGYRPYKALALWLTTWDGGASWEQAFFPNPGAYQDDLALAPAGEMVVVGGGGLVMRQPAEDTAWDIVRWSDRLIWIGFPDDDHGWAIGGGGQILRAEDRGRAWRLETWLGRYPLAVGGAAFPAADLGLAAAIDGVAGQWRLLATDGSGQWTTRADLTFLDPGYSWAMALAFPTPELGFLGEYYAGPPQQHRAPSQLWRTTDGGLTWALCLRDTTYGGARAVRFADPEHGWALAGDLGVYRTSDSGQTWQKLTFGAVGSALMPRLLDFVDAQEGWVLRHQHPEPAELLHTADGGGTWELRALLPSALDRFTALDFVDSGRGWLAQTPGPVLRTEDGGWTWQADGAATDSLFVENLLIHPSGNGWAVGQDDLLVRQASATAVPWPPAAAPGAPLVASAEPNPFTGATTLRLETRVPLPRARLELFDARGRRVRVWEAGDLAPGATSLVWDGTDAAGRPVAAGVYYLRAVSPAGAGAVLRTVRLR